MRYTAQYDRHRGVSHWRVVEDATYVNRQAIAMHGPDRQQIGGTRFNSGELIGPGRRRPRSLPRRRGLRCRQRAEQGERAGRPKKGETALQSSQPATPMAIPAVADRIPKMGKKFFRAKKYKELNTRPSS